MAKTHSSNNSFSYLCWLSALCHCAAISYCIYLTVRQTNLSNELASIKEEITFIRESLIKSSIPAGDVKGDDNIYKKQPKPHSKGDFSRFKRRAPGTPGVPSGSPGRDSASAEGRHNDGPSGSPCKSDGTSVDRSGVIGPRGSPAAGSRADSVGVPAPKGEPSQRVETHAGNSDGHGHRREHGHEGGHGHGSSPTVTQAFRDVTYVRWGKHRCLEGIPFYSGYAVGFTGANSNSLSCVPHPSTSTNRDNPVAAPRASALGLSPVKFNLQGVSGGFDSNLNNKPIQCALCHARRTEVFMVIGWTNCTQNGDWLEAYTGHLMASWNPSGLPTTPSDPICVDSGSEVDSTLSVGSANPSVTYVQPGVGFWIKDRVIPCAVCIKVE